MMIFDWARTYFAPTPAPPPPPSSVYARATLLVATGQIGRGEQGANNAGPDVERYRKGGPGGAWCAAFLAWCLEEAASKLAGIGAPVRTAEGTPVLRPPPGGIVVPRRSHSARTLFANCLRAGAVKVARPAAGDIVLWHRGAANARTGHIGIVSRVEGNAFWSIEGNKGGVPSKVREYPHELGEALLLGFCRLP